MEARDMKSFGVIFSAFLFFARASVSTMSSCCHRVLCSVERFARLHRWPHDVEPVEPAPTKSSRRSARRWAMAACHARRAWRCARRAAAVGGGQAPGRRRRAAQDGAWWYVCRRGGPTRWRRWRCAASSRRAAPSWRRRAIFQLPSSPEFLRLGVLTRRRALHAAFQQLRRAPDFAVYQIGAHASCDASSVATARASRLERPTRCRRERAWRPTTARNAAK